MVSSAPELALSGHYKGSRYTSPNNTYNMGYLSSMMGKSLLVGGAKQSAIAMGARFGGRSEDSFCWKYVRLAGVSTPG